MQEHEQITIPEAYTRSVVAYEKGLLKDAVELLSLIIKKAPNFALAHQLLGVIGHQTGQVESAEKAMREAVRLAPDNSVFLANFVEVLRSAGKPEDAIAVGKRSVSLEPNSASAHSNLGLAYYDLGDLIEAEASQKRALVFDPNFIAALNNLGSISKDQDQNDKAIYFYRKVLKIAPNYLETANNLISILIETDAINEATHLAEKYFSQHSQSEVLLRNRGQLFVIAGDFDEAETSFRNAILINDEAPEAYVGLAQVLYEKNHPELALLEAEKAQRLDPEQASAYHYIGMCKAQLGDIDASFASYRKAIAIKPTFASSMLAIGHLEMEQGNFEAARNWFEEASKIDRVHLSAHIALSRLDKTNEGSPILKVLEAAQTDSVSIKPEEKVALSFALGKCYEDLDRYEEAFKSFARGARLKRSLINFEPNSIEENTDDIIKTFTPQFINKLRSAAIESDQPIFVVGMPRSGTTLTESILASHPKVFGAGELNFLSKLFSNRSVEKSQKTGSLIASLSNEELSLRIEDFMDQIDFCCPGSPHIVDKMPANFQMIGLIHGLMPNAKIIHIARDPFDTCVSNFTRVFERSQYHSYDQIELGRYFNSYVRMMKHWEETLPVGSIHTVHYENLVDNIEYEAGRLIAHCGLDWDESCLNFHKSKRRVRTASVQQVRQPLYATSKEKWRKYERHIQPLIDIIGDNRIVNKHQ
ncbi:sulfotransferase [Planktomarina temperata]|nr:sulfotransferase [Planktomarina temperata]